MHVGCKIENNLSVEYEDDVYPADHCLFRRIVLEENSISERVVLSGITCTA